MITRERTDHFAMAERARRSPLTWVLVCCPKDQSSAVEQVRRIKKGVHRAYRDGSFDARHDRDSHGRPRVWAKWMGGPR
jgi:hypothetical protein